MTTYAAIAERVRLELGDQPKTFDVSFTGNGSDVRFEIGKYPLNGNSLTITVGGTEVDAVSVEERTGVLTFDVAPANNSAIRVTGTVYRYFGTVDMAKLIDSAAIEHTYSRTDQYGRAISLTSLPEVENYPLALLTTIKALYALATDAAFDIDISAPDGVMIPRSERYRQLLDMIATRKAQYEQLCAALNIGVNRIEVTTLRRMSRSTGRLVPLYVPQEVDDAAPMRRILPPIDTQGAGAAPDSVPDLVLAVTATEPFSFDINLSMDLTDFRVDAALRPYKNSAVRTTFTVSVTDAVNGLVTVSLTRQQTSILGGGPYWWDLRVTDLYDNNGTGTTVLEGPVVIEDRPRLVGRSTQAPPPQ